jgi:hypothetical protein
VHQLEELDAFVSDTADMFFDGIHGIVMSVLDLHIPDSTPTHFDGLGDHQVKAISTASVGLMDYDEAWATLFHEKRTKVDVTIGSHLCEGLLYGDLLIAQHADPLPQPVLCVHRVGACDP